ncbi:aldehyde dehydrogenase family protein [Flavitalea sp.]|nr:aldehyde dehydrogenase family protein [Flavitalea sp.]
MQTISLTPMREYYDSGATRSIEFRIKQLNALKQLVIQNEAAIAEALYKDLHKSEEEAYATETGLFLAETKHLLSRLRKWARPASVKTTFANIPSSSKVYRDPLGVVLIIAPWNYPFQLIMIPLMAAIAAGNCAVLKPSEMAPATASLIEKMIAGIFPDNYIRVINGPGDQVIPPMLESFRFDHIFYTGSTFVGRQIYKLAADKLVPVTLELGGKSPVVIEPDADIFVTAKRITFGKWLNAGQTCIAPDYLLVHESVKDKLIDAIGKSIKEFYTSDPAGSHDYGRIINQSRFKKLVGYLDNGDVVYGGDHDISQLYIGPTILDRVNVEAPIMHDEIFGPILPVITYKNTEEAMAIVTRNPDPLAFYLFTRNQEVVDAWIKKTSFGGGCINNTAYHFSNYHLPFGGVRGSGMGTYHGKFSFDLFSRPKSVMKTPFWFDPRIKYPTFKGKIKLLKRIFG